MRYRKFLTWCVKNGHIPTMKRVPINTLRVKENFMDKLLLNHAIFMNNEEEIIKEVSKKRSFELYYIETKQNGWAKEFREIPVKMFNSDDLNYEGKFNASNTVVYARYFNVDENKFLSNEYYDGLPPMFYKSRLWNEFIEHTKNGYEKYLNKVNIKLKRKISYKSIESHFKSNDTDIQFFQALAMSSI